MNKINTTIRCVVIHFYTYLLFSVHRYIHTYSYPCRWTRVNYILASHITYSYTYGSLFTIRCRHVTVVGYLCVSVVGSVHTHTHKHIYDVRVCEFVDVDTTNSQYIIVNILNNTCTGGQGVPKELHIRNN